MRLFAIVLLATLLSSCAKAPDPAVCASLDRTIDHNIKKIALTLVEGEISDKGAMQQAARYTMVSSRLQVIATNVELQSKNNCQVRQAPIDPLVYEDDAMKCFSATLSQKPEVTSLCEFKSWKGNAK
ncbi:hypothetical protein [Caenimonas sp. SL110]|uniref:hypothetical protein n=1 Tax=Caenimonas sp. SL110 TaxID=1450524 RepID=UPI000652CBEE|nr:hypothetical protein [Caenimonas sp. SL110]